MCIRILSGRSSAVVALASMLVSSGRAQAPQARPTSLESEVTEMRTENGAIREQLRKLEEQQRTILQLMDELRRRLDGAPAALARQSPAAPLPGSRRQRRRHCHRNPPYRRRHLPQIETLPRRIPTRTVLSW